jgi:hypothetical protein
MKCWKVGVLAVSICAVPVAVAAWSIGSGKGTFGPLHCTTCWGQTPIPDVSTKAFLQQYVNANSYQAYGKRFYKQNPGDKIIVCNGEVCTTYEMTDSRDWSGIHREAIVGGRPGGIGNGGGGQGGGAYTGPIGSGSHGGALVQGPLLSEAGGIQGASPLEPRARRSRRVRRTRIDVGLR